jgi:hypothetical protein
MNQSLACAGGMDCGMTRRHLQNILDWVMSQQITETLHDLIIFPVGGFLLLRVALLLCLLLTTTRNSMASDYPNKS